MNEDFVTYEIALKLKEKGYKKKCIARYIGDYLDTDNYRPNKEIFDCYNEDEDLGRFYTDAPTISQVLKWLRNTYNLHVETYPCGLGLWKFLVTNVITLEERALCDKYTSSEQAVVKGIEYVLGNLI